MKKLTVEEKKEVTDLVVVIDNETDENISDSDTVPPVDLDLVKCAGESDYESEESADDSIVKKVEEEEWRMTNMEDNANKQEENLISGDVVVENVIIIEDNVIVEDESDKANLMTVEEKINCPIGDDNCCSEKEKEKKTIRGKRGKKTVRHDEASAKPKNRTRSERVPLIECEINSVLSHPKCKNFVQKTGKVVAISEFKHSRIAAGTIKPMADKNQRFALFSPTDSRVPRVKVPMSECPKNLLERPEDYSTVLFVVKITQWDMVNSALGQKCTDVIVSFFKESHQ